MRIVLVNHEFTITGASLVLFRLALRLRDAGHLVSVLPGVGQSGPMRARFEAEGIPLVAPAALREADLVIANTVCTGDYLLQAPDEVKTIWFLHEAEIGLRVIMAKPELKKAFARADAVVFQSAHQREVYRPFTYALPPEKFHVIANGIERLAPAAVAEKARALRIVQVGNVDGGKRTGDLIRAVAKSGLDAGCVICGRFFSLEQAAIAVVAARPRQFHFTGEVEPQVALGWVQSADIYCLTSSSETQALSVMEAARLGRALLLTDLPCYEGVFRHGQNCLMVPVGHVEMLALSLRMYAASEALRREMGAAARLSVRHFTPEAFFSRFGALISALG